ncbi:MAG: helix-turn-helix transcriptional regulator [Armatimonadetes bacterium]|nr:helix-turn-helix transcriptional regulator [Armatimonadota bacterium]
MRQENQPVFMISVAAQLSGVHPQTLRQYERLGLIIPSRVGAKNRLYSEADIRKVRKIQRLTQELGVNLAGVEVILRLLDEMDQARAEMEAQMMEFVQEAEQRIQQLMTNPNIPIRRDESLLPTPKFRAKAIDV